ncbi:SCP2 sterol-binding domain-containing protein [Pseudenhygromyxa sp. WMMC2535]|uniref:SCP2 sterol-binding domain-containing protein n=1 Tax=Pseudenhygromyxa sp. WMMC2535 TaxID=2712867 RepID=UPI00155695AE|nr:SCP2 sterol-binding domain-containing protein [Pseudenhygromyxa sp. WMMC2535]NVB37150.1 SCP2 sterol-binding domain-containing protein [Pseudenhygromyxa sp. WMMC2535]
MSLETVTTTIRERVGDDAGLGATLKFKTGDGVVFIDGKSTPNSVSNEDKDADCTVGVELSDLEAMMAGDLAPTTAFMGGKLKVEGDMGVAMKLQGLMG